MSVLNISNVHLKPFSDIREGDSLWWMSVDDILQEAKVISKAPDLIRVRLYPTLHECNIISDIQNGWDRTLSCNPDNTSLLYPYTYRDSEGLDVGTKSVRLFTTRYECMDSRIKELSNRILDIKKNSEAVAEEEFPKNWEIKCPYCGHVFRNRDCDWMPVYHNKQGCICPRCNQTVYESAEYCKEIK